MMVQTKVMIVEDELLTVELIQQYLTSRGYDIVAAVSNGDDALRELSEKMPDIVLMDVKIKGNIDGIDLTRIINEKYNVPVIYLTAFADRKTIDRAKFTESYGYIIKPFGELELISNIEIALYKHKLDKKLRESEGRYRTLFETMKDAIYMHTMDGELIDFNPALLDLYGYTREEIFKINVKDVFVDKDDPKKFLAIIKKNGYIKDFETREYRKDGSIVHCLITADLITAPDGKTKSIRGIIHDITDRKRAEDAMIESEKRYRAIFEGSMNLILIHDFQGAFIDANDAALKLLGYSRDEVAALSFKDLISNDQRTIASNQLQKILSSGFQSEITEFKLCGKNGEFKSVETTTSVLHREGKPYAVLRIGRDVTEKKKNLEELKNAHAEITHLLNSITSILIGISTEDLITHWNHIAAEAFGIPVSEALGKKITDFNISWDWNEIYMGISNSISENRPINLSDIKYVDKNGRICLLGITVNPIKDNSNVVKGFLIYGKDITERKFVEQQLLQSSKMATIGEIATGIAHELNQPLNIIKMASQYLMDSIDEKYYTEEFIAERIDKIVEQVDRAARIITHLKDFGRKSDFNLESIDPNTPVRIAFDMLGEQLRLHSINVSLELDDSLPLIRGDKQKLEQVFINMIINAKEAFDEMNSPAMKKMIHVKSYFKEDEKEICIEFTDNGPGMPVNIINKIFEPFFTTKEVGKGTGLGLSISYGIVRSHQGTIDVASNNSGTTFIIRLPAASKTLDEKNESM